MTDLGPGSFFRRLLGTSRPALEVRVKSFSSILIALVLSTVAMPESHAQSTDEALLRALVEEIRALRQTLEKSQLFELRASIMLDQMQVRQSSIDKLRQRLSELRQQSSYDGMEEFEFYVEEVRNRLRTETDPEQRRQIEREMEMVEKRREIQAKRQAELNEQIQQLELRLREEEDKLTSLEGDLDRLQRSLIAETE